VASHAHSGSRSKSLNAINLNLASISVARFRHAEYRPVGKLSLSQAIQLISSGIAFARERQAENLIVVTLGLAGFQPPNVIERYYFINEWAKASGQSVHVAVVTYPEMIDPKEIWGQGSVPAVLLCKRIDRRYNGRVRSPITK
jgi:hypothetical protein